MKTFFLKHKSISLKIRKHLITSNEVVFFILFLILGIIQCYAEKNTVRIGIYHNPPKIALDTSGKPFGFWIDLLEGFIEKEELKAEYIPGTWLECLERLASNQIDILPDIALSPERSHQYIFGNEVVYISWSYLLVKNSTTVNGLEDLEGKNIAVLKGSINYLGPEGIKNILADNRIKCNFLELSSYIDVLKAVSSDLAFAGVVSKDFGHKHKEEYGLYYIPMLFSPAKLYFAFAPSSALTPYLKERLDHYLRELKAQPDSLYYQALAKWFGEKVYLTSIVIPEWLILICFSSFIIASLFLLYSLYLRKRFKFTQVELFSKKRELQKATESICSLAYKFNATFDSLSEGVVYCDLQGSIIDLNLSALKLLGFQDKKELVGKQLLDLVAVSDIIRLKAEFNLALARDKGSWIECQLRASNSNFFDAKLYVSLLKDSQQQLTAFICIFSDITEEKLLAKEKEDKEQKLLKALHETVKAMALTVEKRDLFIAGHQQRVSLLVEALGKELGLEEYVIEGLCMAAIVHDIGKIQIPAEILNRYGPLDKHEYDLVKLHPAVGHEILAHIDFPWPIANIVLQHHERLDGSGYPLGLKNGEILWEARILAVADVVEAMLSHRPYRPALSLEYTLSMLKKQRGLLFDPLVVDACLKLFSTHAFQFPPNSAFEIA